MKIERRKRRDESVPKRQTTLPKNLSKLRHEMDLPGHAQLLP